MLGRDNLPLLVLLIITTGALCDVWSYEGATGPRFWCNLYSSCCGERQSPINLLPKHFHLSTSLIFRAYDIQPERVTMTNNGHSGFSGDIVPRISGSHLNITYFFHSLHLHWGSHDGWGSEHTFAGKVFPLEMHLVHYSSKFSSFQSAIQSGQPNALAVLGIMFDVGNTSHPAIEKMTSKVNLIKFRGKSTSIEPFSLVTLIPQANQIFYRYLGSLTTPSCDPVVIWTVFLAPNEISQQQMEKIRQLYYTGVNELPRLPMVNNFRPLQADNN